MTEFKTDQLVPETGLYAVVHENHRLPNEVTLLRDQAFPRCSKCTEAVRFRALQLAPHAERRGCVVVYELPELEIPEIDGLESSVA
jgi:hypothetical protein